MSEVKEYQPTYTVEEFEALTIGEKRRAIARDALAQLATQRMRAANCYLNADVSTDIAQAAKSDSNFGAQTLLLDTKTKCHVCAIGALFVAAVCLGNKREVNPWALYSGNGYEGAEYRPGESVLRAHLLDYYTRQELAEIEACFEEWNGPTDVRESRVRGYWFGQRYDLRRERLVGILSLIAEHPEGLFEPPAPLPHQLAAQEET